MGIFDEVSRFGQRFGRLVDDVALPEEARHLLGLAEQRLADGDPAGSAELAERATALAPGHPPAFHLLASARLAAGEVEGAALAAERAIALRPHYPEAQLTLGRARAQQGRLDDALAALRMAVESATEASPELLAALYRGLASAHLASGRADRAVRELRKAIAHAPHDRTLLSELGRALLQGGEGGAAEAREILVRAVREADPPKDALLALARLDLREGRSEEAEAILGKLLEASPTDPDLLISRAEARAAQGDLAAAHEHALRALAAAPARAEIHLLLARIHERAGSLPAALTALDQALVVSSAAGSPAFEQQAEILRHAIRLALRTSEWNRAEQYAARRTEAGPPDAWTLAARGAARLARGEHDAALEELAASLAIEETVEARLALARLHALLGRPALALAAARAAMRLVGEEDPRPARELTRLLDEGAGAFPDDLYGLAERTVRTLRAREEIALFAVDAERLVIELDQPLLVSVMGEFNSGKSTFVNSLLGEDVAPTGVTPTTATIHLLKYGPERAARFVYQDDRTKEIGWSEVPRVLRALDQDEIRRLRMVELLVPAEELQRINIADTPGLNSLVPEHEAIARGFIGRADVVLWIFAAGQAGKASEREALERIRAEGRHVVGVLNKIDRLSGGELGELVPHLERRFDSLVETIVPYSAREALAARLSGDIDQLQRSRYEALRQLLEERYFSRARTLKRALCAGRLLELVERARDRVAALLAAQEAERASLDAADECEGERLATFERRDLPAEAVRLSRRISELRTDAAAEVIDFVRPRRWPFGMNEATPADRDFLAGLLARKLETLLRESQVRVASLLSDLIRGHRLPWLGETVYARASAYARGLVRGGRIDTFLTVVLPKMDLSEETVGRALGLDALDLEDELLAPLGDFARNAVAEQRTERTARRRLLALQRLELEEGTAVPLDALARALRQLSDDATLPRPCASPS